MPYALVNTPDTNTQKTKKERIPHGFADNNNKTPPNETKKTKKTRILLYVYGMISYTAVVAGGVGCGSRELDIRNKGGQNRLVSTHLLNRTTILLNRTKTQRNQKKNAHPTAV